MSVQQENLKQIADAIREKTGSTELFPANTFAEKIKTISGGGVGKIFFIGEEKKGEIFNDYERNKALTRNSSASGERTIAGCLGYWYSNIDVENKKIILSTTHHTKAGEEATWDDGRDTGWNVGDTLSIITKSKKYSSCCKISTVNGNEITVDSLPFETFTYIYENKFDSNTVYNLTNPTAGMIDVGVSAHAEGGYYSDGDYTRALGPFSHAEGRQTKAYGHFSHAEGVQTTSIGLGSHAEGAGTKAVGERSHAEGLDTEAIGIASHAEGYQTKSQGTGSHAEGWSTEAIGDYSHAEGYNTYANGGHAHVEGTANTANGNHSHAEGWGTEAIGEGSHAEGYDTAVYAKYAHVEGYNTVIYETAKYSHGEGRGARVYGNCSHAEGSGVQIGSAVRGIYPIAAHAGGIGTIALEDAQYVIGKINQEREDSAFIVGNGKIEKDENGKDKKIPSNAYTLDWNGNGEYAGTVTANAIILRSSTPGSSKRFKITIDDNGTLSSEEV